MFRAEGFAHQSSEPMTDDRESRAQLPEILADAAWAAGLPSLAATVLPSHFSSTILASSLSSYGLRKLLENCQPSGTHHAYEVFCSLTRMIPALFSSVTHSYLPVVALFRHRVSGQDISWKRISESN
jgi:hypothetical protein